ncbi:hypothetical protein AMECASPLE_029098, partial [Ameca splendens]
MLPRPNKKTCLTRRSINTTHLTSLQPCCYGTEARGGQNYSKTSPAHSVMLLRVFAEPKCKLKLGSHM